MFRQAENKVKIEGILAETDLKYGSFERNGQTVETISGMIKVLVEQEINGTPVSMEVPVYMFTTKMTRAGKLNPAYESIEKVMKEYVSIAACGSKEQADKVRINSATIRMNEFIGQGNKLVSYPRVNASFVSRAIGDFKPEATFTLEFVVSSMSRAVDDEGIELDPPKLNLQVIVPQYTAPDATVMNIDNIPLVATSTNVINAVEGYWEPDYCYKASSRLNFSSRTEEVIEEVDFGEAQKTTRTTNISELIVTGGSQAPLDGEYAWELDDIKAAVAAHKQHLEDIKNGKTGTARKVPAREAASPSKKELDLGF